MIRNYLKIASRNLVKSKFYSLVNILGLAMGMAACFFIFQYVYFESSYDKFHKNASNIYRVPISYSGSFSDNPMTAANHPAVGPAMKAEFPEVLDFTRLVHSSLFFPGITLTNKENENNIKIFSEENLYFADSSFFNIFTFPFLTGDPAKALTEANSIVISDSLSHKYFSGENPIGKTLYAKGGFPLKITGVFKNIPENSHLKLNAVISFITLPGFDYDQTWTWPEFYNYVLLRPGSDPKKTEAKFPAFINKHLGSILKEYNFGCRFYLQPMLDIHLHSNYIKEASVNGSKAEVTFLSIIGLFILIIAWINYINLSTVKSMERAKEVGLRKVVGAGRGQLITQFLFESVLINLLALLVATVLILSLSPSFSRFIGKNMNTGFFSVGLGSQPYFWTEILGVFAAGALLVGAYPAFVLSAFRPVAVLKGIVIKSNSRISLRRVLVSFQFILSIILIAATLIVSTQLSYMKNQDLGYKKDQLLVIKSPDVTDSTISDKFRYFQTELGKSPSVLSMAASSDIPGRMINLHNGVRKTIFDKTHNVSAYQMEIDENFKTTFEIKLAAGRNFSRYDTTFMYRSKSPVRVMINEEAAKMLGFKNNEEAVNEYLTMGYQTGEIYCQIIGVTRNFHQRSLKEKYDPIVYYFPGWHNWKYFSVNLNTGNLNRDLSGIESTYHSSFPGNPFEYFFLDDYFNQQYQTDQRLGKVFALFATLAIVVACLGLLGLSSFVIKVRTKEIGIRKVLGASITSIMVLFSRDFVKLVSIASVIAIPIIYFFADRWLTNYAFRISIGWTILLLPPFSLLVITLLTICLQSLKAARNNPTVSLRSE